MLKESNFVHCKKCGELKERIHVGKYGNNNKDKKYEDKEGHPWNGLTCPACHKLKIKEGMKKLRFQRALDKKDEIKNEEKV